MPEAVQSVAPVANPEVENLKNQLAEAQKKIGEQGGQLKNQTKYVEDADSVAQVIQANPELQTQLRDAYAKHYGAKPVVEQKKEPGEQPKKDPTKKDITPVADAKVTQLTEDVGELKKGARSSAIKKFEDAVGITELPDEQKKDARRQIEQYVNTFGQSIKTAQVSALPEVLDLANKAINVEKMVEDGKMEGMAELYNNQSGSMPSMSGRRLDVENEGELTPGQLDYTKKLGVDPEQAKKVVEEKENEQERLSGAERRKIKRDKVE